MQLIADRARFISELQFLAAASRHPMAGWLALDAEAGHLTLSTHNSYSQLSSRFAIDMKAPGRACVPATGLPAIIPTFTKLSNDVNLRVDERGRLEVLWRDFTSSLQQRTDIRPLPVDISSTHSCDAASLRAALTMAAKSADHKNRDAVFLLGAKDSEIIVATTDRRRLTEVRYGDFVGESFRLLSSALSDVKAIIATGDIVTIGLGRHISIECNGRKATWPQPIAKFPAYAPLFPAREDISVEVDRKALLAAVTRVALMDETDIALTLALTPTELAMATWRGDATESVLCVSSGTQATLGLNGKFMRDALESMETERIQIVTESPLKPIMFRPVGAASYQFRSVIMPITRRT